MQRILIVWAKYHRRSELLAEHLGATIHYIQYGESGRVWMAPIRYPIQTWQTWRILARERPQVILVQNPPIFAVCAVHLYARVRGAHFVIDSHTGAFLADRWRWSLGLHRFLSRRALTTLVHNTSQEQIVKEWGCSYCVVGFTPGDYTFGEDFPLDGQFNVAVISTFKNDEPIEIMFEAARCLPGVDFYFTGSAKRIPPNVMNKTPANCHLTGYLPYEAYVGLLRAADVIMDLTTRDHTLLMGGFEAVSIGTPLITSDWPILKEYFFAGTLHVPNTVEGICTGVRQAQTRQDELRQGIHKLRQHLDAEWNEQLRALEALMNDNQAAT